jgi:hypothetical protein
MISSEVASVSQLTTTVLDASVKISAMAGPQEESVTGRRFDNQYFTTEIK